jgi:hypothetical protein
MALNTGMHIPNLRRISLPIVSILIFFSISNYARATFLLEEQLELEELPQTQWLILFEDTEITQVSAYAVQIGKDLIIYAEQPEQVKAHAVAALVKRADGSLRSSPVRKISSPGSRTTPSQLVQRAGEEVTELKGRLYQMRAEKRRQAGLDELDRISDELRLLEKNTQSIQQSTR